MTMTKDQIREAAYRLYCLAWRSPEQAPIEEHRIGYDSTRKFARYVSYLENGCGVSATVNSDGRSSVSAWSPDGQSITIEGTPGYVETILRAIPYSLRPHVGESK